MTPDSLDERFEAYLARDDDALTGGRFFEILAEIERRREEEADCREAGAVNELMEASSRE